MTSIWTGTRVRLRGVDPQEWAAYREFDQDTDVQRRAGGVAPPMSDVRYQAWTREVAEAKADPDHVRLSIARVTDDVVVGMISTHGESLTNGHFSYGLALGAGHHRKGYGGEAVRILFGYLFRERRFHKAEAGVYADNEPSLAFHRAFGFVEEGRLREHEFLDGRYVDEVLFGLTAAEYDARYPR